MESAFPLFPMLRFSRLRQKPRLLRSLTSLTLPQFVELANRIEPLWKEKERKRLSRENRVRAIGAGHPYALRATEDKLILLLTGWRHGLTHELLGCMFDLDQGNVTRLLHRLTPVVEPAADPELRTFLRDARKKQKKIGTMEEFLRSVPELAEIIGDTTEQQRNRPTGKRKQRKYYSGKKKRHTIKTEVIATPGGKILHVSESYPGPTADTVVHKEEKLPSLIPKETLQRYDLGFEGLQYEQPDHDIRLPHKRKSPGRKGKGQRGPPLTRGQKQANTIRAKRRIRIEHTIARAKKYRILAMVWRSRKDIYNDTFRGIAALLNYRLASAS